MTINDPYGREHGPGYDETTTGERRVPDAPPPPPPPAPGQAWGGPPAAGGCGDPGGGYGRGRPMDRREARAAVRAERARAKALRPWYAKKRWWLAGGLVVLIAVLAIAGSGGDDGDTAGEDPAAGATEGGQEVYAVGQTAHTGDFDVTVHQVQDPFTPTNQFESPRAGHRFVAVEVEVRNTGTERAPMSTLLGAEVTDSMNRPWNVALAGLDLPHLDGEVGPGEARRGWMVFEVAQDATGLRLRLKGNLTATGSLFALG